PAHPHGREIRKLQAVQARINHQVRRSGAGAEKEIERWQLPKSPHWLMAHCASRETLRFMIRRGENSVWRAGLRSPCAAAASRPINHSATGAITGSDFRA